MHVSLRGILAAVAVLAFAGPVTAQVRVFPAPGESGVIQGGVTAIGGTNAGYLIPVADVDASPDTTDSSSEVLTLPDGVSVTRATLVWMQDYVEPLTLSGPNAIRVDDFTQSRATLVAPDGGVHTVQAQGGASFTTTASVFNVAGRWAWADVTDLMRAVYAPDSGATQRVAVGNIVPATSGSGNLRNALWAILVVYEGDGQPLRSVAVDSHGKPLPATDGAVEVTLAIDNLQLPSTATVAGSVIVYTSDGQASLNALENIYIDERTEAQALVNAANPFNSVWNHSISYFGAHSETARPDPRLRQSGAAGIDLDVFDITGLPTPGATAIDLIATTTPVANQSQEYVSLMALALAVDVQQPEVAVTKTATVLSPDGASDDTGVADVGDRVAYAITLHNVGNDQATDVVVSDLLPPGAAYHPGSLTVDGAPVSDDDDAVSVSADLVSVTLPDLAIDATATVAFEASVDAALPLVPLANVARVDYGGASTLLAFANESPAATVPICGNGVPEGSEACDDGDPVDVNACRNDCTPNPGPETCDDGYDNDGDGLIDDYDLDDCAPDVAGCVELATAPAFSVRQVWESSFTLGALQPPAVGDLDGDGRPEVVAAGFQATAGGVSYAFSRLAIVRDAGSAAATVTYAAYPDGESSFGGTAPAIGELVASSPGREIAILSHTGRVLVFAADGSHLVSSAPIHPSIGAAPGGDAATNVQIADLDADGQTELIAGNAVLTILGGATATPSLAVAIPLDTTRPRGNVPNGDYPAIIDLLTPLQCGHVACQGAEIAAGGTVYAVDLEAGALVVVARLSDIVAGVSADIDGSTAIADADLDGDLDVIFTDSAGGNVARDLYVYDPASGDLVYRAANAVKPGGVEACWGGVAQARALAGALTVAEVYDERADGHATNLPELMFTTVNAVRAYNVQAGLVWQLSHADCSAVTGLTAFDFNGDGVREVVLNDEQRLRIVYGGAAPFPAGVDPTSRDWASFAPSGTATLTEHPVVADVDADGEADIIAITSAASVENNGRLRVFASNGAPWRPARPVWNQRGFHGTNVNDDLTIPRVPQSTLAELPAGSGAHPLNVYNAQAPHLADLLVAPPLVVAADVEVRAAVVANADPTTGVSACATDGHAIDVALTLENVGGAPLSGGASVAFYAANPFDVNTTLWAVTALPADASILAGETRTLTVSLPDPGLTDPSYTFWVVVNDDGTGSLPLATDVDGDGECARDVLNAAEVTVLCSDCGNGVVEVGEGCDDADANGQTICGCTALCQPVPLDTPCDDGLFCTGVERCEGGACVASGDPCDEPGAICVEADALCVVPVCGNGLLEPTEQCDDGNVVLVDACADCAPTDLAEVCDDGFDNDGDGLLDGFDLDDCGPAAPTCVVAAAAPDFGIVERWTSPGTYGALQSAAVGDLDGDGAVDVVVAAGHTGTDYRYSTLVGVEGAGVGAITETSFTLPGGESVFGGGAPSLGDVFLASPGAEVLVLTSIGRVHAFAATGAHLGASAPIHAAIGPRYEGDAVSAPNLADLDGDGRAEIVVGNAVLTVDDNATAALDDDVLTVVVPLDRTAPRGNAPGGSSSAVADLRSAEDCGDAICNGLEVAAGGTIWAIDLDAGERRAVARLSDLAEGVPAGIDGPTAVADLDGDGVLDVAFTDTRDGGIARDLYIWNAETGLIYRGAGAAKSGACGGATSASTRAVSGGLTIAEVYDERADGFDVNLPEVLFATVDAVRAYNAHAGMVWGLSHADCSGQTGLTAFDFNGDGVRELVMNDEQRLRIVYGGPAPFPAAVDPTTRDWARFQPSGTATLTEHPIVADVDGDGAAEIVAVTSNVGLATTGRLRVFASSGAPWRPARPVWNQRNYRAVHVTDALGIPGTAQDALVELPPGSGQRPLNLYNAQPPTLGDLVVPAGQVVAADVEVRAATLLGADPVTGVSPCGAGGELGVRLDLENLGDAPLPGGTPVTFYATDPFADGDATPLGMALLGPADAVAPGATVTVDLAIANPGITTTSWTLYLVVNDDGTGPFPLDGNRGGAAECVRDAANGASVQIVCNDCGNGVVEINEACDDADDNGATPCGCSAACAWPGDGVACDDGLFCTVSAACDGEGACQDGVRGDANSPCEGGDALCDEAIDACHACDAAEDCAAANGAAGACRVWVCRDTGEDGARDCVEELAQAGAACPGDGLFCTGVEACDAAGDCVPGSAPCVLARCDEDGDVCAAPFCGDGIVDEGEVCDAGAANGASPCACDDECAWPTGPAPCDDGRFCTVSGVCDGAGACEPGPRSDANSPCEDGDALCDEDNDVCQGCNEAADCVASEGAAPDCRAWACRLGDRDALRECALDALSAGSACGQDGAFCNGEEACDAGGDCVSGDPPCAAARCDEATDVCAEPRCGDGIVDASEECDDGGASPLDGCDARCVRECTPGVDCYCDRSPGDEVCNVGCTPGEDCFCDREPAHPACDRCAGGRCVACVAGLDCYCDLRPQAEGCQGCDAGACPCDDPQYLGKTVCPMCVAGVDCPCDLRPDSAGCPPVACTPGVDCLCDRQPQDALCNDTCAPGEDCFCDLDPGDPACARCGAGEACGGCTRGVDCYCDLYPAASGCQGCAPGACVCDGATAIGGPACPLCAPGVSCYCELHPEAVGCATCVPGATCLCDAVGNQDVPICDATCDTDADCADATFCNGVERCAAGACVAGPGPCATGELCDEADGVCLAPGECGDGALDDGEECDDGNVVGLDGCSPICELESGLRLEGGGGCAGGGAPGGLLALLGLLVALACRRRRTGRA